MIGIIDYGVGNIKAFANIYKSLNFEHKIVQKVKDIDGVKGFILPGVGSFDHAMDRLNNSGLREELEKAVLEKEIPVLGICVGMQMLANTSDEGSSQGLGWIDGVVKKFSREILGNMPLPHMGWNEIEISKKCPLLMDLEEKPKFYFLHSFYFCCNKKDDEISTASYGRDFTCIVRHKNIFGVQCHPEKSHHNGIKLLKNFGDYCASV